jgi:hypothetical protein
MPTDPGYHEAYPRAGQVALLCEGDLVGYEASILRRWTDARLRMSPFVDIWPCGTGHAIYGMSDAIGRSRPLFAIEDRDFRTIDESKDDCQKISRNRQDRGIRLLGWRAWSRNEIENYLLEPEVLYPVMADAFGCTTRQVEDGLIEVLPSLVPFQALQFVVNRARRLWEISDPARLLWSGASSRPNWDDSNLRALAANQDEVRQALEKNLAQWRSVLATSCQLGDPTQGFDALAEFDRQLDIWQTPQDASFWQTEWTGKDTLQWLRILLSARFGVWDADSGVRVKLRWQLSRSKREAQDRPLESALRPRLAEQLVIHLTGLTSGDLHDEWAEIEASLRKWNPGQS